MHLNPGAFQHTGMDSKRRLVVHSCVQENEDKLIDLSFCIPISGISAYRCFLLYLFLSLSAVHQCRCEAFDRKWYLIWLTFFFFTQSVKSLVRYHFSVLSPFSPKVTVCHWAVIQTNASGSHNVSFYRDLFYRLDIASLPEKRVASRIASGCPPLPLTTTVSTDLGYKIKGWSNMTRARCTSTCSIEQSSQNKQWTNTWKASCVCFFDSWDYQPPKLFSGNCNNFQAESSGGPNSEEMNKSET